MIADIVKATDKGLYIFYPLEDTTTIENQFITKADVHLIDGRLISIEQRKKAYALMNEIAAWNGDMPEVAKEWCKYSFIAKTGCDYFSLSTVDRTTAREYITHLIDFCLYNGVPTHESLLNYAEDIDKYLYGCLVRKKCAVCGKDAELHHVDRVGMGRSRKEIAHVGMKAIALCRTHHSEAHTDEKRMFERNKIYGIQIDEKICEVYFLRKERRK